MLERTINNPALALTMAAAAAALLAPAANGSSFDYVFVCHSSLRLSMVSLVPKNDKPTITTTFSSRDGWIFQPVFNFLLFFFVFSFVRQSGPFFFYFFKAILGSENDDWIEEE